MKPVLTAIILMLAMVNVTWAATYNVIRDSIACIETKTDISTVAANVPRITPVTLASIPVVTFSPEDTRRAVNAVDESRGVALIIQGAEHRYLEKCSDPTLQTFTTVIDSQVTQPMKAYFDAAAARDKSVCCRSVAVLPNGNYLLCLGYTTAYDATLWDSGDGYGAGQLYLSTDGGVTWSAVLKMQYGYVDQFGWSGISGSMVAAGEYRDLGANNGRNVYLSNDYGETWETIYAPDAASDPWSHVHDVCFISDTQIAVSVGDGVLKDLFILTLSGGSWSKGSKIEHLQPTAMVYDGGYLYCGNDGSGIASIDRLNLVTGEYIPSLKLPSGAASFAHGYTSSFPVVLLLKKINGVFYAGVTDYLTTAANMINGGLYVSIDGINWTCIYRIESTYNQGVGQIGGILNGKLWFTVAKANTANNAMVLITATMDVPSVKTVNGYIATKGVTNQITDPKNSNTFAAGMVWTALGGNSSIAQQATGGLYGGQCLKVTCADDRSSENTGVYTLGGSRSFGTFPTNGTRVTVTAWVKRDPDWPVTIPINIAFYKYDSADITIYNTNYQIMSSGWIKLTVNGLVTSDWTSTTKDFRIHITSSADGARGKSFYLDAVKVEYSSDRYPWFSAFTPGGTVRADEVVVFPLVGFGKSFTSSFFWHPQSSVLEWGADVKVASWVGSDGSHIDLFWQQSSNKFGITDGVNTVLSTGTNYKWRFRDIIKFSITSDGINSTLTIQDPLNGSTSITGTAVNLTSPPILLMCGSDYANSDYGTGIYVLGDLTGSPFSRTRGNTNNPFGRTRNR